jgi:hypothetical protein
VKGGLVEPLVGLATLARHPIQTAKLSIRLATDPLFAAQFGKTALRNIASGFAEAFRACANTNAYECGRGCGEMTGRAIAAVLMVAGPAQGAGLRGGARGVTAAEEGAAAQAASGSEPAGIVYLRSDANGSKPYVGQAKSDARFLKRQSDHARNNPDADFDFEILGRAEPGTQLDRLEEYWIRRLGGPSTPSNPGGGLANARHQMSEERYRVAGGDPDR